MKELMKTVVPGAFGVLRVRQMCTAQQACAHSCNDGLSAREIALQRIGEIGFTWCH